MTANKSNKIDLKPKKDKTRLSSERKNLILILAVSATALIIFFLWIFVLRISWRSQDSGSINFGNDFKKILDEPVPELVNVFDFKEEVNIGEENDKDVRLKEEASDLIENIIKEVDKSLAKPKPENCPEWINCMPRVGAEVSPCQVPLGCEDITQIVY